MRYLLILPLVLPTIAEGQTAYLDLTALEAECQRIGFAPKTEKFGECVLELHKRAAPRRADPTAQTAPLSGGMTHKYVPECTKMGFKEGTPDSSNCALSLNRHEAEMALYQQQLQVYQRQVDQTEKANRLAATQRLLEIANQGFAMAAGDSSVSVGVSGGRRISPSPPAPIQFMSPGGNRYTCAYSGVQLVCR
jgi:hypothetical protein